MDKKEGQYGFDANFVNEVPDFFKCVVCHLVLRQPVQIMTCGHRFCKPCYERIEDYSKYLNTTQCCPIDREVIDINQVFEDTAVSRDIGNLQVICSASFHGCMWRGDLKNLQVHEEDCQIKVTKKPHEQTTVCFEQDGLMKDLLQRLEKCEQSLVEKEKGLADMIYNLHEMQSISERKEQEFDLLQSSNAELQNEVKVIKKSNEEMRSLFEKEIIGLKDENKILEMKVISLEAQLDENMNSLTEGEVNKMFEKHMKDLKIELANNLSSRHNETVQLQIGKVLKPVEDELSQLGKDVQKTFNELTSVRSHTDETANRISNEVKSLTSRVEATEKSLENDNLNELTLHVANIENILFTYMPYVEKNMKFKWVLTDCKSHFEKAEDVCSPLFYPQLLGYCFKLHVEWTGENNEDFGLFLRLCCERDIHEDLKPFRVEYELAVLRKTGTYETDQVTFPSIDEYKDNCFTILPKQQTANKSFGCANMLKKDELEDYLINDTLYITCTFKLS